MSRKVTRQSRVLMERIKAAANSRLMRLAQKMIGGDALRLDRVDNSHLHRFAALPVEQLFPAFVDDVPFFLATGFRTTFAGSPSNGQAAETRAPPSSIRLSLALIVTSEGLLTPGLISYGFFFGWAGGRFGWSGGCAGLCSRTIFPSLEIYALVISSRSFFRLNSISAILCSRVLCSSGICSFLSELPYCREVDSLLRN